ncbi:MAG: hypothetical protein AAFN63_02080 [Pseudomonadota bacterium]
MSDAAETTVENRLVLATSLRQTGRYVQRMGHIVLELEDKLFAQQDDQALGVEDKQGLQSLDLLKQTADELAALLERLADAVPKDLSIDRDDILHPMKLQEIRDMIGGTSDVSFALEVPKSDKQVEMF